MANSPAEASRENLETFQMHKEDVGSSPVQIARLTHKISDLSEHFSKHPKDHHSRRGLIRMINQRRRLLSYIKRTTPETYRGLIQKLGLRR